MASDHHVSALPEKEDGNNSSTSTVQLGDCEEAVMISTLPKVKAWEDGLEFGDYYQYQGFWHIQPFLKGLIWAQQSFMARDTDIFLASYPKCGTTWLKALMYAILNRNIHQSHSHHPLLTSNPHDHVLLLESQVYKDDPIAYLESLPSPRLLATHSSYTSLPDTISSTWGTRIVYIARNPKDVLVSLWKFLQKIAHQVSNGQLQPLPIEEAFESFCKGESINGPFWDHVLGYWEASKEDPNKVLFLKYEDLKKDTEGCVKRLAEFMHCPFSLEEEKQGVVQEVINLCSFENLSNLEVNKTGTVGGVTSKGKEFVVYTDIFFRKGQVGDSINYLTPDMLQHLDKITEHKLGSAGLKF